MARLMVLPISRQGEKNHVVREAMDDRITTFDPRDVNR